VEHAAVATLIVEQYRRDKRDLPWRRTRDPYAIWVSEIMLQQTRVQTVIPYWERWMTRFPTVTDLASAPLDDVLAAWAGLGYYSRARNLWSGAREVTDRWNGALPGSASELREVKGIGPYTAGAIASIAFGERTPLVDGNVARVLARVFAMTDDIKSTTGQRQLWTRAGELMSALPPAYAAGELNQGLMELGATVCVPQSPRCLVCPVGKQCIAARTGRQDELPVVAARKKESELPILARAALWLEDDGEIVLARREPQGLFGGLWELPQGTTPLEIAAALGVTDVGDEPVAYHDQTLSHRRLRIAVFRARAPRSLVRASVPGYDAFTRVSLVGAKRLGVAAATTAILTKYEDTPWRSIPRRSRSSRKATTRSSKASASSATTSTTRTSRRPAPAPRKRSTSSSTTRSR
jgi:A/G-specific adenine glycosylase